MIAVLNKIKPSREEEIVLRNSSNAIIKRLNSRLKEARAVLGGSAAKGTWLKGDYDIDIFVKFNRKYSGRDISKILEKKLNSVFKNVTKIGGISKMHGSRDYFQLKHDFFTFELVPILNIKKPRMAENITDVSPFHTKWIKDKTDSKLVDEIRLTKALAKANKLYGAESYIKGFSGYVLEILTIYYKSFQNLIKAATKWKKGIVIDVEKHKTKIKRSKFSPLVVIDPVQPNRNAAAALSERKFNDFIELAKRFSRNPSLMFFEKKKVSLEKLKSAIILKVVPRRGKKDIIGAKLLKCLEYIKRELNREGFRVESCDWEWDKEVLFWYFVKKKKLNLIKKHFGPPIKEVDHVKKFKRKYKRYKLRRTGNKIYVELKREYPDVKDFIKNLIRKDEYVREKVKEIELFKN